MNKAEDFYNRALALHEALGNKEGIARDLNNLGNIAKIRGEPDQGVLPAFAGIVRSGRRKTGNKRR